MAKATQDVRCKIQEERGEKRKMYDARSKMKDASGKIQGGRYEMQTARTQHARLFSIHPSGSKVNNT